MPPPLVEVMTVQEADVEVVRNYSARVHGSRQVQMRAGVEGILKERLYEEGRLVERDEVLFRIDPKRYEIALRRAEADLADARARLNHARREWTRYAALFDQAAVSELERDRAMTDLEQAQARFAQAGMAVDDAQRNLGYTEISNRIFVRTKVYSACPLLPYFILLFFIEEFWLLISRRVRHIIF